jgi:hypothetical protein
VVLAGVPSLLAAPLLEAFASQQMDVCVMDELLLAVQLSDKVILTLSKRVYLFVLLFNFVRCHRHGRLCAIHTRF